MNLDYSLHMIPLALFLAHSKHLVNITYNYLLLAQILSISFAQFLVQFIMNLIWKIFVYIIALLEFTCGTSCYFIFIDL